MVSEFHIAGDGLTSETLLHAGLDHRNCGFTFETLFVKPRKTLVVSRIKARIFGFTFFPEFDLFPLFFPRLSFLHLLYIVQYWTLSTYNIENQHFMFCFSRKTTNFAAKTGLKLVGFSSKQLKTTPKQHGNSSKTSQNSLKTKENNTKTTENIRKTRQNHGKTI